MSICVGLTGIYNPTMTVYLSPPPPKKNTIWQNSEFKRKVLHHSIALSLWSVTHSGSHRIIFICKNITTSLPLKKSKLSFFQLSHEIFSGLSVCPFSSSLCCLKLLIGFPFNVFGCCPRSPASLLDYQLEPSYLSGLQLGGPSGFHIGVPLAVFGRCFRRPASLLDYHENHLIYRDST